MTINQSTLLISQVAAASSSGGEHKSCGQYRRGGAIPLPKESVWGQLETNIECDEMEFCMFIVLSRESFDLLVSICEATINITPLNHDRGKLDETALKKSLYRPRGIMAMTVKFLTSVAESNDLYVQFGATSNVFRQGVELGMVAVINNMNHPKMRVFLDQPVALLENQATKTSSFLDITGVVGMVDGRKMLCLQPAEWLDQNRDYNGWTKEMNRNFVLLWNTVKLIVDAAVIIAQAIFMIANHVHRPRYMNILLLCQMGLLSCVIGLFTAVDQCQGSWRS